MSRVKTEEEIREEFLAKLRADVRYWVREAETGKTTWPEAVEGAVFSALVTFDGGTGLPAFKIIPMPHPDDKKFAQDNDENWYPDDVDICDGELHSKFLNNK